MAEYIKLLENYFNLTQIKDNGQFLEEIDIIATQIIAIQEEQVEITRVLKYKGNLLDIQKGLEKRAVKASYTLPAYTILEEFEE